MKICVITCYKQPDYIRAKTLRAAVALSPGHELIVVKNEKQNLLRYVEVLLRIIWVRIRLRPDIYILTFRGYEMLFPVRFITMGKPLVFDEFINLIEWVVYEHKKLKAGSLSATLLRVIYRMGLRSADGILTDTWSHAKKSAEIMKLPIEKFYAVLVGTDDETFSVTKKHARNSKEFTVFYYGNMLPLHGLQYVIETAVLLKDLPLRFVLIGGNDRTAQSIKVAIKNGANIDYKKWVDFTELPTYMSSADVCLAGPFGGTFQSQYVITGKAYQYLAVGRPTIVGENKESGVFTDKKDALVVRQGSAEALEVAIRWAYQHRDELDTIGQSGRKLYEKEFSAEAIAEQLQSALAAFRV